MKLLHLACLAAFVLPLAQAQAAAPKIMVFDFYLDNTSLEPTSDAEKARIKMIGDQLRAGLEKSGQYEVIAGNPQPLTSEPNFSQCTDQQIADARRAGAALAACGWVQKVSNLILNLNLIIEDTQTGKALHGGSVDIRGNTDDSWSRGLNYLLQEHVFQNH